MSNCSHTLYKILWVFLYSIPSRVYYITKSYHALPWLIQYRNWFLSEMTAVILKQRKNLVLFSRTVIALTQSNEYLILKQNPRIHFIFQGTEIWRGKLFERVFCSSFAEEYEWLPSGKRLNILARQQPLVTWVFNLLNSVLLLLSLMLGSQPGVRKKQGLVGDGMSSSQGWHTVNSKILNCPSLYYTFSSSTVPFF